MRHSAFEGKHTQKRSIGLGKLLPLPLVQQDIWAGQAQLWGLTMAHEQNKPANNHPATPR
jgi:hypothetical protein